MSLLPSTVDPSFTPHRNSDILCVRTHLKNFFNMHSMEDWVHEHIHTSIEPFYTSFDLRDAGFKLAPVDANLYPAGFNNLCPEDRRHSPEVLKPLLKRRFGKIPQRMAILPELHTKNHFYVDNLYFLREIFRQIGIQTEIGWLHDEPQNQRIEAGIAQSHEEKITLLRSTGEEVFAYPFAREGDELIFAPFKPEFILLNNDLSSGFPPILKNIIQPIEPAPEHGWHSRRKNHFFDHYNRLAAQLAEDANLDPWRLQVQTKLVQNVDFDQKVGLEAVAEAAHAVLTQTKKDYLLRQIDEVPFVFVKSNTGTYGMGILKIQDASEILALNRRDRNKMSMGKGHSAIQEVIVQEGIPTRYKYDVGFGEPVIYLMGHELLGGFIRKNPTRGRVDNLNAKGMVFEKLCLSDLRKDVNRDLELELVYGTIAKLSSAAVALEIAHSQSLEGKTRT